MTGNTVWKKEFGPQLQIVRQKQVHRLIKGESGEGGSGSARAGDKEKEELLVVRKKGQARGL